MQGPPAAFEELCIHRPPREDASHADPPKCGAGPGTRLCESGCQAPPVNAPFSRCSRWWWVANPKSEIRNPKFRAVAGREFRQDYCLHTTISYAIVPLPLPIGRGVFFVMSEMRESKCCWRSSMVEQLICNQQVAGSIPIASSNGEFCAEAGVAEWLKAADCKSAGILPTVVRTHPPAPLPSVEKRESRE